MVGVVAVGVGRLAMGVRGESGSAGVKELRRFGCKIDEADVTAHVMGFWRLAVTYGVGRLMTPLELLIAAGFTLTVMAITFGILCLGVVGRPVQVWARLSWRVLALDIGMYVVIGTTGDGCYGLIALAIYSVLLPIFMTNISQDLRDSDLQSFGYYLLVCSVAGAAPVNSLFRLCTVLLWRLWKGSVEMREVAGRSQFAVDERRPDELIRFGKRTCDRSFDGYIVDTGQQDARCGVRFVDGREFVHSVCASVGFPFCIVRAAGAVSDELLRSHGQSCAQTASNERVRVGALIGDRAMQYVLAVQVSEEQGTVAGASVLQQKLLTNAAFSIVYRRRLAKIYPEFGDRSEKACGTLVEALVGFALMVGVIDMVGVSEFVHSVVAAEVLAERQ